MKRGILATIYIDLLKDVTEDDLYAIYHKYYGDEKFVRIRRGMCETRFVTGTNYCDISVRVDRRTNRAIIAIPYRQHDEGRGGTGPAEHEYHLRSGRERRSRQAFYRGSLKQSGRVFYENRRRKGDRRNRKG